MEQLLYYPRGVLGKAFGIFGRIDHRATHMDVWINRKIYDIRPKYVERLIKRQVFHGFAASNPEFISRRAFNNRWNERVRFIGNGTHELRYRGN
jgi:hypothetical protein